jgi:hypothetical protein
VTTAFFPWSDFCMAPARSFSATEQIVLVVVLVLAGKPTTRRRTRTRRNSGGFELWSKKRSPLVQDVA